MGLPIIEVEFQTKADTAVVRSGRGIAALIIKDETKTDTSYVFTSTTDVVKTHWTAKSLEYISLAFEGSPKKVIVERIGNEVTLEDALKRLANKKWNYLACPTIEEGEVSTVAEWIKAYRTKRKTFKAVLPHSSSDNIGIINFDTDEVKVDGKTYTAAEFCACIAGIAAGTPIDESMTGRTLSFVESIKESLTPDDDIDNGKLILINDGESVEIARGVNSLVTVVKNQSEDMKSIKIVDGMDLIADDIRDTFAENYRGRANSLENKELFVVAVNQYFESLTREGVLYDGFDHYAEIDIDAQKGYLIEQGKYESGMSDTQIKQANTGTYMFLAAHVQMQNAAEDLKFVVNM